MTTPPGTRSNRAQSSVVGAILLIGLVVVGTGLVLALGTTALTESQDRSELARVEHTLTLFDSRAAMVALGESRAQSIQLGSNRGQYLTEADSGRLWIEHHNYSLDGDTEVVFNRTLGAVVYERRGTEIAYQGGGVWKKPKAGGAKMLSAPEFHYRGTTLTLPIVRVRGEDTGAGAAKARIESGLRARTIFPNTTAPNDGVDEVGAPYNGTEGRYDNPVANGTVTVSVTSEYYQSWAEYFRTRTDGRVEVFDSNQTVDLTLISLGGPIGKFQMPDVGESIMVRGVADGHPINDFTVDLKLDKNKPHFSFYEETDDGKELELHVYVDGNPCTGGDPTPPVDLSVHYHNGSSQKHNAGWQAQFDASTTSSLSYDCSADTLRVDFLAADLELEYGEIQGPSCGTSTGVTRGNKWAFMDHIENSCEGWSVWETETWDQHESSVSWEGSGRVYEAGAGDTETLHNVTNHYMSAIGKDFELIAKDGPGSSDAIDEPNSGGNLMYDSDPSAEYITFLHVTENRINVSFD
jgi:flagellin-like protein